jgi:hypothetical protein
VTADPFGSHALAVVLVTGAAVLASVLLHYETFTLLLRLLGRMHLHVRRRRVLIMMFALVLLHVAEIWLFAFGYYFLALGNGFNSSISDAEGLLDLVYYSASVYTTLGFGDLIPHGAIRFLTGTEAITGFLLITWSASFTFLEMQRFWKQDD